MKQLFTYILLLLLNFTFAQKEFGFTEETRNYQMGVKLYKKGLYASAQSYFEAVILEQNPQSELHMNADYYYALCALALYNNEADQLLEDFIQQNPHDYKSQNAKFELGRHYYRLKKYKDVIKHFEKLDQSELSEEEKEELYFKVGHSYFSIRKLKEENLEKSLAAFYEIKQESGIYYSLASFYKGYILYAQRNYASAAKEFDKIKTHPNFQAIVPYFLTQIYYHQKKYEEMRKYALPLIASGNAKRSYEISRLVGEAYYREQKYKESVPYLQTYIDKVNTEKAEDLYQLAYAQYKSNMLEQAVFSFERLVDKEERFNQLSYFYLGDLYLKMNMKEEARMAFKFASQLEDDPKLTENALLNYAKLAFELSDPYQEAIKAFNLYLDKYPMSAERDEVLKLLLDVYVHTKNYKEALDAIDKIKIKDLKVQKAYQKIAFAKGVEIFNDQRRYYRKSENENSNNYLLASIHYFQKSLKYPIDKKTEALAHYWIGEGYYRLEKYDQAIAEFNLFKYASGILNTNEYKGIDYQIAYCFYKLKSYDKCIDWFRKFTKNNSTDSLKINDAFLRVGDSYFVQNKFEYAIDFYSQALVINQLNSDYALMQLSLAYGLTEKNNEKINTLNQLIENYKNSKFLDDAQFLLAETYFAKGMDQKAYDLFLIISKEESGSALEFQQKSRVRLALLSYKRKQYEDAKQFFKGAIALNPKNEVSAQALDGLKDVYTVTGNVDEWIGVFEEFGLPPISTSAKDTFLYMVGRENYLDNKFSDATVNFQSYIDEFPNGFFITDVNYFKADCHMNLGQLDRAVENYEFVLDQPIGDYTEDALLQAARIYLERKDWENVIYKYLLLEDITDYYPNRLEARVNLMRAYNAMGEKDQTSIYAKKVAGYSKVPNEVKYEAQLLIAKMAFDKEDYEIAMTEFQKTVEMTKSEIGAEAKYHVALLYYLKGDYTASKQEIFELAKQIPSYKYWVMKAFILLSDNYLALEDEFHAEHTLKTVLENFSIPDLNEIAQEKLKAIQEKEDVEEEVEEEEWEIDLNEVTNDSIPVSDEE